MLDTKDRKHLKQLAINCIQLALENQGRQPPAPPLEEQPDTLQKPGASFVTLERHHQLRGCIGSLIARQPLALDVWNNAYQAAFRDPRFPPLQPGEFPDLDIKISVLSDPEPMHFTSEEDLLQQIRPGIDGLILKDGPYQGTFLPSVWEQLPEKQDFWLHLKNKAGLPANHWSDSLQVYRYTTEIF